MIQTDRTVWFGVIWGTLQMNISLQQKAIDATLFRWPSETPVLLASRCLDCEAMSFPLRNSCSACGGCRTAEEELPRRGTLWTYTLQRFMPKPPYNSGETGESFEPYGVGYVELPGALRIESRIHGVTERPLAIGMEMELQIYCHRTEADGTRVMNYAFRPVGGSAE